MVVLLILAGDAAGQAPPPSGLDPDLRITQYIHRAWTANEGLPQNAVYATLQTSDGYLWLGTQDGLVRFDGVQFTTLNKTSGLASTEVRALLETTDGSLWIGTNGGGVSRLRSGTIETFRVSDGLPSDLVRSLYESRDGAVWIGTIDGGVARFDGHAFKSYSKEDGLAGAVVLSILEHDGALWLGTEAGLSRFDGEQFKTIGEADGIPGSLVWELHADPSGSLLAGTNGGLVEIRDGLIENRSPTGCGNVVSAIRTDSYGALWLGTLDAGVCRIYQGRVERFSTEEGLTNTRVRALSFDAEGNLWIGTERGGLNVLKQGKFIHYTRAEGLSDDVVFSVTSSSDGTVWIGTEEGGLNVLREGRLSKAVGELPTDQVYALDPDEDGALWIGTYGGGVCRIQGVSRQCYAESDGLSNLEIYAVLADKTGRVWVGTNGGLFVKRTVRFEPFPLGNAPAEAPVTAIVEDSAGRIWVGTYGNGVRSITQDGTVEDDPESGLDTDVVLVLHEDWKGLIWAGTQGGGICLVGGSGRQCVTSSHGLHNDNILQILEDDAGHFWLGTLQGIIRVAYDDLSAVLDGRSPRLASTVYDRGDGLKTTEMSGGTQPSAWKTSDGVLWFATNHGVAFVDPGGMRVNPIAPPVHIVGIEVKDRVFTSDSAAVLRAGLRDVTFRYTGLSFTSPDKISFQYMLEGYDASWVEAGARREAFYTNLPPGAYRFRVRAANADGVWNENGASAEIYLKPFFYETWWFGLLSVAAFLLAVLFAYRLRIRHLKARERELERVVDERTRDLRDEKEKTEQAKKVIEGQAEKLRELDRFKTRFFANVSHEFRTPLTMIIGPLENLLAGAREQLPDATRSQIEMMLRNALRLMRLINQLLDLSKLEDGKMHLRARPRNLVPFVEGIVSSCSALTDRKEIALTFESYATEVPLYFEPDKLEKVFFNLLSNAAKFTPPGGAIDVRLSEGHPSADMADGYVELRFSDTGKGIPPEHLPWIFDRFHQVDGSNTREHEGTGIGLALVKELILLHHGTISVESVVGRGTVFSICLPKGNAHLQPDQITLEETSPEIEDSGMTELATTAFDVAQDDAPQEIIQIDTGDDAPLILIVDDNTDVREYVAGILSGTYRVAMAADGEEGLRRAHELMPDLILSDVMMPRMDGTEMCRRIKNSAELLHIPVILLTARATHQLKLEALEMRADDYLSKPFNADELLVRIRNLLHLRRQEKELRELNDTLEEKVREQFGQLVEERRRYEEELIHSKERAEASDRMKSTILNNLSHEFRTPLTAIMGFSQIIESEGPEDVREFTAEIERGGKRLLRTLDSLLQLSRIEADDLGKDRERVDLSALVADVVDAFRPAAGSKGLQLDLDAWDGEELWAELDRTAFEEVVSNVIDNAVKFTEDGSVSVSAGRNDGKMFVRVRDTGVGIGDEFLPRMFDAFVQESDGLSRSYEGCGLGLTIAKRLVEIMDGSISVESQTGNGSCFTISIPDRATPVLG